MRSTDNVSIRNSRSFYVHYLLTYDPQTCMHTTYLLISVTLEVSGAYPREQNPRRGIFFDNRFTCPLSSGGLSSLLLFGKQEVEISMNKNSLKN